MSLSIKTPTVPQEHAEPTHTRRQLDKSSLNYILRTGLAGGVAGCTAKTLIAPLDRIKILFQTSNPQYVRFSGSLGGWVRAGREIYRADGLIGFYQGHSATLLRVFPYAAIKFVSYEQIRRVLIPSQQHETTLRRLMSGSIAGLCSVFVTYPLDLIRVRLAFQTKHEPTHYVDLPHKDHVHHIRQGRLTRTIADIYREHPIVDKHFFLINWLKKNLPRSMSQMSNFYRGFIPTIMGMVPYAGVSFLTHDLIHDIMRSPLLSPYTVDQTSPVPSAARDNHRARVPLNTWAQLIAGGLAGMIAQSASYPFEVIRRRMQVGGVNNGEFIGMRAIAKRIFMERGIRGFYVGLSIGFIKIAPMMATSFYIYERCKLHLGI